MRLGVSIAAVVAAALATPAAALGVCVEGAYPPFSEVRDDGTIVGFDIDIAEALCTDASRIWPSRYGPDGKPNRKRGQRALLPAGAKPSRLRAAPPRTEHD